MRRAPLALLLGLVMIGSPLVAAAASSGGGQAAPSATVVTLLDPLVNLPGIVVSLDFMTEKNGKVKHSSTADQGPMKFAGGKSKSVGVHLQFNGTGTDIDREMAALVAFAKVAGASNGPATITLVWGHLGAFDVEVTGFNSSSVNITHDHVYQHHLTDLEFVVTQAAQAAVPRDVRFQFPDIGVQAWMVDFEFTPTLNWNKHRESRPDAPELEFTAGAPRSMSFELMFDGYEEGASVKPAVSALSDKAFTSTSPNATGPVEFAWGDGLLLRGFLVNMSVTYTMFLSDGEPVRVSAHGNLTGLFSAENKGGRGRQTHSPPPVLYRPGISLAEPPVDINATLMALNAWTNSTDGSGQESVTWEDHRNAEDKPPEYTSGKPMNMSVELMFDGYESNSNVKVALGDLLNRTVLQQKGPRPPAVVFAWGDTVPEFAGVIESLTVKYTLFLPDGTPVRATADLHLKNASQAAVRHVTARAAAQNGTVWHLDGTETIDTVRGAFADVTFDGPMTGNRAPLVDWVLGMASGNGSSLKFSVRLPVPTPSAGAWACTQVTYTPPQFTAGGAKQDKITVHAEVTGIKQGVTAAFDAARETLRCTIDPGNGSTEHHGPHAERQDEYQKATGFTIDISGNASAADTMEGGAVVVELTPAANSTVHLRPGKAKVQPITLERSGKSLSSDWGDWYNASQKLPNGLQLRLNLTCTGETKEVVSAFSWFNAYPSAWHTPDMDSDKSGMAIERINITVEKVERA